MEKALPRVNVVSLLRIPRVDLAFQSKANGRVVGNNKREKTPRTNHDRYCVRTGPVILQAQDSHTDLLQVRQNRAFYRPQIIFKLVYYQIVQTEVFNPPALSILIFGYSQIFKIPEPEPENSIYCIFRQGRASHFNNFHVRTRLVQKNLFLNTVFTPF